MRRRFTAALVFLVGGACSSGGTGSDARGDRDVRKEVGARSDLGDARRLRDAGPLCGNGRLDPGEECEGLEVRGNTCVSLGRKFTGGTLGCQACQYDVTGCFSTAAGHATLIYGAEGKLVVRELDTKTGSWGAAVGVAVTGSPRWIVNRISPVAPVQEVAAATAVDGTAQSLHLLHRGWVVDQSVLLSVPASEASKRVFDLAYERKSGEALVVYSDNTSNPSFFTYSGGSWSGPKKVFSGAPPGTAPVRWVTLASSPLSDEITVLYSDSADHVYGVTWSGSGFAVEADPCAYCGPDGFPTLFFDAAYESQSGNLMVANGDTQNACMGFGYRRGSVWETGSVGYICAVSWFSLRMVPQRGSNGIALIGPKANVAIWSGSAWYPASTMWQGPGNCDDVPGGDIAWVGAQPVAIAVQLGWLDASVPDGEGHLYWVKSSTGGTWQNGTPLAVAGMGALGWVRLAAFPAEDRVLAVFSDHLRSLWTASYELSGGWSIGNGGQPLASNELTVITSRPFSFDITQ
jgi:hypothetical protein